MDSEPADLPAEHAPLADAPLALPSAHPPDSRSDVAADLYRSANRRLIFGPLCGLGAGVVGLGSMAVWSPDFEGVSVVGAVHAEGLATGSVLLLASGVQLQRRAQMAYGIEPRPNAAYPVGLALGGGALLAGLTANAALTTENRTFIYATTGTAGALGAASVVTLIVANVIEARRTAPYARGLHVSPGGVTGTW